MAYVDDIDLNKLLKDVDNILVKTREVENTHLILSPEGLKKVGSPLDPETQLRELDKANNDGFFDLQVSEDGMEVRGDFFPPIGKGKPLTIHTIEKVLQEKEVVWGVHWPLIKAAVLDCFSDGYPVKGVLVAAGIAPVSELAERCVLRKELLETRQAVDQEALTVDWKERSPLLIVQKGTPVAQTLPAQEGAPGCDVWGNELPFAKHGSRGPEPGSNVVETPQGFAAGMDGVFRFSERSFWIDPVLVLEDGVNYKTGNIDFPGDVMLKGEISPGFQVRCKGNLYSRSVIDATNIDCDGDVVTPIGIIGKGSGRVNAKGKVIAKFLENVVVRSQKTIEVRTGILNSAVQSLDKVKTGPRSLVMGSKIQAQNGAELFQIGSERGAPSEIHCGIDFSVLDKIVWIRDQNLELIGKIRTLEGEIKKHPEKNKEIEAARKELRDEIRKLNSLSESLLGRVDRNEEACVVVRGTAYPGTVIEICHISMVLSKPMSQVRFFLDRKLGKIVNQSL